MGTAISAVTVSTGSTGIRDAVTTVSAISGISVPVDSVTLAALLSIAAKSMTPSKNTSICAEFKAGNLEARWLRRAALWVKGKAVAVRKRINWVSVFNCVSAVNCVSKSIVAGDSICERVFMVTAFTLYNTIHNRTLPLYLINFSTLRAAEGTEVPGPNTSNTPAALSSGISCSGTTPPQTTEISLCGLKRRRWAMRAGTRVRWAAARVEMPTMWTSPSTACWATSSGV